MKEIIILCSPELKRRPCPNHGFSSLYVKPLSMIFWLLKTTCNKRECSHKFNILRYILLTRTLPPLILERKCWYSSESQQIFYKFLRISGAIQFAKCLINLHPDTKLDYIFKTMYLYLLKKQHLKNNYFKLLQLTSLAHLSLYKVMIRLVAQVSLF